MKKELFIFDLDGTLIDAYQAIWETLLHTLSVFCYPPVDFEIAKRAVGYGDKNYIPRFFKPEHVEQARKIYREYHLKNIDGKVCLLPGARQVLEKLKQDNRIIGVASNRASESGLYIIKNLGIIEFFFRTVFGDQVQRQKPEPDMILKLIEDSGIRPQNTVFIGDMTIDVLTGKNAGVDTIVVPTGSSTVNELIKSEPSWFCNSLFDVLKMLDSGII